MSLLMEALRRAEQAKQAAPSQEKPALPPAQDEPEEELDWPEAIPDKGPAGEASDAEEPARNFHGFDWDVELHLEEEPAPPPAEESAADKPSLFDLLEQEAPSAETGESEISQAKSESESESEIERETAEAEPAEVEIIPPLAPAQKTPPPLEAQPERRAPTLEAPGAPAPPRGIHKGLIVLLLLVLLVVGGGLGYLYYQDASQIMLPPPEPGESFLAMMQSQQAEKETPARAAEPALEPEPMETSLAEEALRIIARPETPPAPAPKAAPPPPPSRAAPAPAVERFPPTGLHIRKITQPPALQRQLGEAYSAYQSGDQARAGELYQRALSQDPRNRDALLGLAGLAVLRGDAPGARGHYQKILELYPEDPVARAGLLALNNGQGDGESQLKTLLGQTPEAAWLHFQLGNLYQRQGRWAEAQQAYFDAFHHDKSQPDYAYNLAVSLDRLGKSRQALDFYARALELAQAAPARFEPAQVSRRMADLREAHP